MENIKFGTDGWRAVVGEDFNNVNVCRVSKAIGKYIFDNFGIDKKIIIGYDPRNMAEEFSLQAAEILSENGFNIMYSSKIVPTPVIAYSAKFYNACAVMFTASHNPPQYLGIKFIPDYAGPATDKITGEIVRNLDCTLTKKGLGKIEKIDFSEKYFEHIEKLINIDKIKDLGEGKIIYDGFYSSAIGYFDELLNRHNVKFETMNMNYDKNFGGMMPDPKPQYLKDLIEKVKHRENCVGFANDGDGDRFGIINELGVYVSPNEIIAMLLLHLIKNKKLTGKLVKTVGSSLLLNKIAEKLGVEVIETAVGFKNVGEAMRKYNALIGGEESGGLTVQGHIPEKDGILANLLVLEMMAYEGKTLVELQNELFELVGCRFFNTRVDKKLHNIDEINPILEKYKSISDFGGFKVKKIDTKDGVKLYFDDDTSWMLVRPSGTEPLLRIYFESDSEEKLATLKTAL